MACGGGASNGRSIVALRLKFGVGRLYFSRRLPAQGLEEEYGDVVTVGPATRGEGTTVFFEKGGETQRAEDVDVIIHATGYESEKSWGFVDDDLQVDFIEDWIEPRLLFNVQLFDNPRMFYAAIDKYAFLTFADFEAKGSYIAGAIGGGVPEPDEGDERVWREYAKQWKNPR